MKRDEGERENDGEKASERERIPWLRRAREGSLAATKRPALVLSLICNEEHRDRERERRNEGRGEKERKELFFPG